jgi:hypothetical protein
MTRACVHLGVHKHPVKDGEYQDFKDCTRPLLREQVERNTHAINSKIVMDVTKELVEVLLLGPQGALAKTLNLKESVPVLEKCKYMSSPNNWNDTTTFRYFQRFGIMDTITMLRGCSH